MRTPVDLSSDGTNVGLFLLTPDHVTDEYVGWLNDPAVNRFLESRFTTHTVESTKQFVSSVLDSPESLFLGIRHPRLPRHVGNIKLGPINTLHRTAEIGLMIGAKDVWGSGVATSAIRLVGEIARRDLGLRKVTAGCYVSNVGSRRAFEKAGFSVEGIRPRQLLLDGVPEDLVLLGLCLD